MIANEVVTLSGLSTAWIYMHFGYETEDRDCVDLWLIVFLHGKMLVDYT